MLTEDILSGAIRGYVVVPSYFSEFRHREKTNRPIQVIADGKRAEYATFCAELCLADPRNMAQNRKI